MEKVVDLWSTVHAVIRYQRKDSAQPFFEVCVTATDLAEKKISLLFDQEINNLEVVGGEPHAD